MSNVFQLRPNKSTTSEDKHQTTNWPQVIDTLVTTLSQHVSLRLLWECHSKNSGPLREKMSGIIHYYTPEIEKHNASKALCEFKKIPYYASKDAPPFDSREITAVRLALTIIFDSFVRSSDFTVLHDEEGKTFIEDRELTMSLSLKSLSGIDEIHERQILFKPWSTEVLSDARLGLFRRRLEILREWLERESTRPNTLPMTFKDVCIGAQIYRRFWDGDLPSEEVHDLRLAVTAAICEANGLLGDYALFNPQTVSVLINGYIDA